MTDQKTGIIGAMEQEVASLRAAMAVTRSVQRAGMTFTEGKLGGAEAVVVQCGVGKVNAGICVQILADEFHVTRIINTGAAGSLDHRLRVCDVVISTEAIQHDFDVSPLNFQKGEVPYTGLVRFPADATLRAQAAAAAETLNGPAVYEGSVCSGDQFIAAQAQKDKILADFPDGLCCEMEGAAVAQASYLNGIPFVVIRAISDAADSEGAMSFQQFSALAAANGAAIVRAMLKQQAEK